MTIDERNEKFAKRLAEETANPHWNCRFHPTDYWHEWGCPHKDWSTDELQKALISAKASSVVNAEFAFGESEESECECEECKQKLSLSLSLKYGMAMILTLLICLEYLIPAG
jgi:hypothetical protein